MFADDLFALLDHRHFGEEVFNEVVRGRGSQVPLEFVHQDQLHLLRKWRDTCVKRGAGADPNATGGKENEWGVLEGPGSWGDNAQPHIQTEKVPLAKAPVLD